jgi:two-component system response regulator ResD
MLENPINVLIVDDEESVQKELRNILEKEGYRVDTAENGEKALQKAQAKRFDVALIDFNLPDIEGPELCLKLPRNEEIIKIVITGFPTSEDGVKAADCGADDFLVKPVQSEELIETIKYRLLKL